jgi:glycosyltransferase involved in cell wall biosynthesis
VPGINLVGFLEGESGLSEVSRRLGAVLRRASIPLSAISYRRTPSRQQHRPELPLAGDAHYDTNLICLNADGLAQFAADVGIDFFANRYSIGVWFWETNVFRSEDRAAARFLDEIWVASDYVQHAIGGRTSVPVHVVPVPVDPPSGPFLSRSELELPDGFTFLFLFDFVSAERKNPMGVVDAFTRAFVPGEGPRLLLKSINGRERKPKELRALLDAGRGREDIIVRDGYVSALERDSYFAACDCYVSLHRSEGFGLTIADAMAYGKPVIATGYSGNLEFMNEANSYLVPYELVEIPPEWWAYAPGALWAQPDTNAAAELIRLAWERPDEARALGQRARAELSQQLASERTTEFIRDRLAGTCSSFQHGGQAGGHDARPPLLRSTLQLGRGLGADLARTERRGPVSWLRRMLYRALWPYLEEERRYQASVLDTLEVLEKSQRDVQRRLRQLEAERTVDRTL